MTMMPSPRMIRLSSDIRCIMCVPSKLTNFYLDEIASVTMQIMVSSAHGTLVF
jgi:hypothetical protein